jgi:regulator of cell morphogenesis and NO signaling
MADVLLKIRTAAEPAGRSPDLANDLANDWPTAPLGSLIDHILTTHHAYMKSQLPRLSAMLAKILVRHPRHEDVLRPLANTFRPMRAEFEGHLMKEETILFPLIRQLESSDVDRTFHCGSVQNPIRVMVTEYDSAGESLARLRDLTGGYALPDDACTTFRAFYAELAELERDLHPHMHLENEILFPRAVKLEAGQVSQ